MLSNDSSNSGAMNMEHLQNTGLNFAGFVFDVIGQPLDLPLRPWSGTRYHPLPVRLAAAVLMILLPAIGAFYTDVLHMVPFLHVPAPRGMFDLASFAKLYFLLSAVQGYFLYKKILHPENEQHSEFEGPPLPFFSLIPWLSSFWKCRIVAEPLFILILATVLQDFYIIQPGLALYLRIAAFALSMKSIISWFRSWQFIRGFIDNANAAPLLARLIENKATDEDLNVMHLASFPTNLDPEIHQAAVAHIARAYSPEA